MWYNYGVAKARREKMKFRYNGTLDEFIKEYSVKRDKFNKENRVRGFELVVYLRAGFIEIGVENGKNGVGYWFKAPVVERDGYVELEGEILPDGDARMRWYEWGLLGLLCVILCIPLLLACLFTKSFPFSTQRGRENRLRAYLCEYLGCEEIK